MKYTIGKIQSCTFSEIQPGAPSDTSSSVHPMPATLVCKGIQGKVTVSIFSLNLIYIRYDLDLIQPSVAVEKATESLRGCPPVKNFDCTYKELDDQYLLECNTDSKDIVRIFVCKENANITVERNGKIIHGGEIGTKDTVLPREQLRYFTTEKEAKTGRASFFFPLAKADRFFGLGDKCGYPNRRMYRYRMYNRDSLGYNAEKSDPLYKSIPFFIKHNPETNVLCGLYFPLPLIESFDFGKESPFYFSTEVVEGPMEYYVLAGSSYKQILQSYCEVTGFPALPPLFSFGFLGSSMNYVEPDDAQKRIEHYFDDIEKQDIPCEGMYVSSGYLKADDGKRYAFVWNKKKFPDYGAFLDALGKRGYNLIMNIKPGILTTHPWYKELYDKGYFVKDSDGKPCVVFYWGGNASFIDFSNPQAFTWWKDKLKEVFLSHQNCGIWNDNNELELEDPQSDAYKTRTLFSSKMCQAAFEASQELDKSRRPWLTTRSGYAGIQKYSRTWSGDNVSDWITLKFNQFQGWSLGLSGLPFYGHDLGGFFGDVPSEELLIRSCQSAVFQPRFVIHSWRENGEPTEAWTYPNAFPVIRKFIYEHYKFMPYIYNCALESSTTGIPLERPLFLEYLQDTHVPLDSSHCQFGPSILKILIVDEGKTKTDVYLPKNTVWYDVQGKKLYSADKSKSCGNTVTFDIPLDSYAYLAKVPSIIPTAPGLKTLKHGLFDTVEFLLFPSTEGTTFEYTYFEDDGRTILSEKKYNLWKLRLSYNRIEAIGTVEIENEYSKVTVDPSRIFAFMLPAGFIFEDGTCTYSLKVETLFSKKHVAKFTGSYT
ncbi:MAG: glycoside hydrolase [Treponema sp.]|nr:glycoside hydrolase [Treponema sp.]